MSLESRIRDLLSSEIAGGRNAYEDVEILLAAWRELHRERTAFIEDSVVIRRALARLDRETRLKALRALDRFIPSDMCEDCSKRPVSRVVSGRRLCDSCITSYLVMP